MPLLDLSLRDLLNAFSSSNPTPGGGSAAALASSVGASLLLMVAALPKSRTNADQEKTALHGATTVLTGLRQQLAEAIDAVRDRASLFRHESDVRRSAGCRDD